MTPTWTADAPSDPRNGPATARMPSYTMSAARLTTPNATTVRHGLQVSRSRERGLTMLTSSTLSSPPCGWQIQAHAPVGQVPDRFGWDAGVNGAEPAGRDPIGPPCPR